MPELGTDSTYNPAHVCPYLQKMVGYHGVNPPTQEFVLGQDDHGCDFKVFGATSGAYMLWDESADELVLSAGASIDLTAEKVQIDFKAGDASSVDPGSTNPEAGWININVDGTKQYIPYFDAS